MIFKRSRTGHSSSVVEVTSSERKLDQFPVLQGRKGKESVKKKKAISGGINTLHKSDKVRQKKIRKTIFSCTILNETWYKHFIFLYFIILYSSQKKESFLVPGAKLIPFP